MRQEAAGTLQRRQLGEGYGGGVGEKKKGVGGRTGHVNYVPGN